MEKTKLNNIECDSCKICCSDSLPIFQQVVLNKYEVCYYKCSNCSFIQTENPYWLKEAYSNPITALDIGLIGRNTHYQPIISRIIKMFFNRRGKFVDYGGGYGIFVRLMRDIGYDYYRQDIYCDNLFAKSFDVTDTTVVEKFEMLTAFEVFEHLADPLKEIEKMLAYSDNILFSTESQPNSNTTPENWWYFIPETGQHIALYSKQSLAVIASKFNLNYYNSGSLHLYTKKKLNAKKFEQISQKPILLRLLTRFYYGKNSLLMSDFNMIKNRLNDKDEYSS